jgi:hypothetical protein
MAAHDAVESLPTIAWNSQHTSPPEHIFGQPLTHYAHKSDVVRLQVLQAHGGIYLDLDTLVARPFDSIFVPFCALAQEWNLPQGRLEGLCNAVILAQPRASFISRWLDAYEFFHFDNTMATYAFFSVKMPLILARQNGADITVLPPSYFFRYWCDGDSLAAIFEQDAPLGDSYSVHLWETQSRRRGLLPGPSLAEILDESRTTTYARLARPCIGPFEREHLAGEGR